MGRIISYGEVYWVDFNGAGCQFKGIHPAVVIQNNLGNKHSSNIQVVPISSVFKKANLPTQVTLKAEECGLIKDSVAHCESQTIIQKSDFMGYMTVLPQKYMKEIGKAVNLNNPLLQGYSLKELKELLQLIHNLSPIYA